MLFSIVVPVYNVENLLERCVNSLVNQTYKNIDIILVNDGSTDGSGRLCDEFENKYENIRTFHKKNGGLSDARNIGIESARGEYIIFVDSDDYIDLNTCHNFYNIIKKRKPDILVGSAKKVLKENIVNMEHSYQDNEAFIEGKKFLEIELSNKTMHMAACLNLYNKKFLFDNNLRFKKGILHEDEEFVPRAFLRARKIISTNIFFYFYVIREGSITSQKNQLKNVKSILKIVTELESIYDKIERGKLKTLLEHHSVSILINGYNKNKISSLINADLVDLKFLFRNSNNIKMKLKTTYFVMKYFFAKLKLKESSSGR